jgi:hypothetical protein
LAVEVSRPPRSFALYTFLERAAEKSAGRAGARVACRALSNSSSPFSLRKLQ